MSKTDKKKNQKPEENSRAWVTRNSVTIGDDEKVLLKINEYPLKRKPVLSVFVVIFYLLVSLGSLYFFDNPLVPVFVFAFFVISNTSFFMPSEYTFTEEKFIVDRIIYRKVYPWSRFRGFTMDNNGVYLSPSSNPDRFDRFRGVFLLMRGGNREKIKPISEEKIHGTAV
ncbi:MAG: hypothetical protein ACLFQV_03515, partial [Vulcanimicrobiota bacterium]